jgi:hypothetical protein
LRDEFTREAAQGVFFGIPQYTKDFSKTVKIMIKRLKFSGQMNTNHQLPSAATEICLYR